MGRTSEPTKSSSSSCRSQSQTKVFLSLNPHLTCNNGALSPSPATATHCRSYHSEKLGTNEAKRRSFCSSMCLESSTGIPEVHSVPFEAMMKSIIQDEIDYQSHHLPLPLRFPLSHQSRFCFCSLQKLNYYVFESES